MTKKAPAKIALLPAWALLVVLWHGCAPPPAPAPPAAPPATPDGPRPAEVAPTASASEEISAPPLASSASSDAAPAADSTSAVATPSSEQPSDADAALAKCKDTRSLFDLLASSQAESKEPGPLRPWEAKPIATNVEGLVFYRWVSGACHARPVDQEVAISCGKQPLWVRGHQLVADQEWGIPLKRIGGKLLRAPVRFQGSREDAGFKWKNQSFPLGEFALLDSQGGWFFQLKEPSVKDIKAHQFGSPRVTEKPVWPQEYQDCVVDHLRGASEGLVVFAECLGNYHRLTWDGRSVGSAPSSSEEAELDSAPPLMSADAPAWAQQVEQCDRELYFNEYGSHSAPRAPRVFMSGSDYWLNTSEGVYSTRKTRDTWAAVRNAMSDEQELAHLPIRAAADCPSVYTLIGETTKSKAPDDLAENVRLSMLSVGPSDLAYLDYRGSIWLLVKGRGRNWHSPFSYCVDPTYLKPIPEAWLGKVKFAEP